MISAKVLAHSVSPSQKEIITFELEFPRLILAEFNTHNAISKNCSSSRAIPVQKMLDQVRMDPAMPVRFGEKNPGMQDKGVAHTANVTIDMPDYGLVDFLPKTAWEFAATSAAQFAEAFDRAGYHKQVCNRLIEPFQLVKVVMTATDLNNFFWLRDHPAADPTIASLAECIKVAKERSTPVKLLRGEWHVPYYKSGVWREDSEDSLEDALIISASCCAQVSFRTLNDSMEKAKSIYSKLNLHGEEADQPVHASPTEHQATPIVLGEERNQAFMPWTWDAGITHVFKDKTLGSGNFKGWIQHRQLVPNNVKLG